MPDGLSITKKPSNAGRMGCLPCFIPQAASYNIETRRSDNRASSLPGQGIAMSKPELCVIFNPTAGKHRGRRRLERLRQSWGTHVAFRPTQHAGHAVELAEQAAREGFSVVAAAGGDGTAHEVLNGLMHVRNPDVQFSVLPIGLANDYASSLGLDSPNGRP